jgi:diguanylate cyclase (GGDEF)-like protein/PAS domain S-box-containing protein
VDPSDRERINLGSGSPHGGTDGPTHATGQPEKDGRWLRSVVENSSEIIKIVDPDGTLRYASPAFDRILGYDSEEAIGTMNVLDHVHPDDLPHVLEETEKVLSEGGIATNKAEYRFLHKDGSWRWMESMGTYLLDDPAVGGVVVTSRDITERKEVEERLREAKERYRTLVEQIPAVTYIDEIDETSSAIYMSPQVEGMFGYTPEEWLEDPELWMKILHPEDKEWVLAESRRTNETGDPFRVEYRMISKSGHVAWVRDEAVLVKGMGGRSRFWQGVITDVTERKVLEEQLEHQAFHDPLTDLSNRRLFMDRLGHALARTQRRRGMRVAVLFMDLDGFKVVNDSLGHETGDRLLVAVSERLKGCLRPEDTLARFGGDEFVVLLEDVEGPQQAVRVAERIIDELKNQFVLDRRELYARASIGIALGEDRTKDPDDLLRDADTAMYRAKDGGLGYSVFDPVMYEKAIERLKAENDLGRAVEQEEFVVHYQPIVSLQTGEVFAVEALVRWDHPERGLLDPDEFIPMAEESGLVIPMGEQVLREACLRAKEWQEAHPRTPHLVMSVNLSARQLSRPDLAETVEGILKETGLEGSCLTLDVTETIYVRALAGNTATLDRLRDLGARISIDDFGVGYSSLAYLKRLPADALKIDRSFVMGLGEDVEDTAIVHMIIELAHTLGLEVIAEGVESEGQATLLREMVCDMAQGYHLSKPLPPEEIPALLSSDTPTSDTPT